MLYHMTFRDYRGGVFTDRVSAGSRGEAIRTCAGRNFIPQSFVKSAVALPKPRAVTPYPETLTPGQG